eukprot:5503229-Amphidinium_carterae.1
MAMGASCRAVVASWSLGYFELVQHMRHTRVVSEYTSAGFNTSSTWTACALSWLLRCHPTCQK